MNNKIKITLLRTNQAYKLYARNKKYYQAKRIYKANKKLYKLLNEFLFEETSNKEETLNFIFHLEDWFEQFKEQEKLLGDSLTLDSEFVFLRKKESPSFPLDYKKNLD